MDVTGLAIGSAIAMGASAIATGWAEKAVGAAAVGAVAEKPELFGRALVFMVIPETIILFGFIISFLLFSKI